jgi:pilus assembly protein Flp/PilA
MQKPDKGLKRRTRGSARLSAGVWLTRRLRSGSPGQGMVEYSLILMLIAIVVIVIFVVVGHRVSDLYSNIDNGINTASG